MGPVLSFSDVYGAGDGVQGLVQARTSLHQGNTLLAPSY